MLCADCLIPVREKCFTIWQHNEVARVSIPEVLANVNFGGYAAAILYKYRVRLMEAAAGWPVLTASISYYVEGQRGHLLNAEQRAPQNA